MGILFAFVALLAWGFGDFLIQRSARRFGDWVVLFYVTAFAGIVFFPFVYRDVLGVLQGTQGGLTVLGGASILLFIGSLLNLEGLRRGKIAVIEAMYAFEVFVIAALGASFINETLSGLQIFLIIALVIGIVLVSIRSPRHFKNFRIERGVGYAALGTIAMGAGSFVFGVGARETNPLLVSWFTSVVIAAFSLLYLIIRGELGLLLADARKDPVLLLGVSIADNLAWLAFAYSALFIPIAIATGLSESYIVLAALLGFLVNREKLESHQWVGFALAVISAIALAVITEG